MKAFEARSLPDGRKVEPPSFFVTLQSYRKTIITKFCKVWEMLYCPCRGKKAEAPCAPRI